MRLIEAFSFADNPRIAFVGAGGKTTAIFRLARQAAANMGQAVLVSATTHLAAQQTTWADAHHVIETVGDLKSFALNDGVTLLTGPMGTDSRTVGLEPNIIAEVGQMAREKGIPLLIEADGSRRKPLKAPANHEPVIPPWVDEVVVSAGMSGVGKMLDEKSVHRPALFSRLAGIEMGGQVSPDGMAKVLLHPLGGLKGIPEQAHRSLVLNQCDSDDLTGAAKKIAPVLLDAYSQVILARLNHPGEEEVIAVHRRIAGVVLAAGGSARLGKPKQFLDWHGKSFVRAVVETALAGGLSPVLVITGAEHDEIVTALSGLPVEIVHNPDWEDGQSTSVRIAVESLPRTPVAEVMAAVFLLVDQPQIPARLVQALTDLYAETLSPIIAPLVDDRRGNPVLFDRATFGALQDAVGDAGGRQIFSRFPVKYLTWLDAGARLDVDTAEDYDQLLRLYPD